jgi:peptide/nickel transport system permease protein
MTDSTAPAALEPPTMVAPDAEPKINLAGQWQLTWWRFRRHRVAVVSGVIVILIYLVAIFGEFLAPFPPEYGMQLYPLAPPQPLHFMRQTPDGVKFGLYVNGFKVTRDPVSLRRSFGVDESVIIPVSPFGKGADYKLFGLIPSNIHLITPDNPADPMFLIGGDRLGRDVLSRTIAGTRISMSIGLIGVGMSLFLGILLGGISGYFGGVVDLLIQRLIEILHSIPTIPLWMGLAAAIPQDWTPVQVYFAITVILSLIGWTGLAREVRGKFMGMKNDDFVIAARLDGSSELHIIGKHMVPSFLSHIIASMTLAIPAMILAETALSFLGIGLRPPVVSWGVLLQEAQNVRSVASSPWLFLPGVAIVVAVLCMNFLGDGLIDAADPYGT